MTALTEGKIAKTLLVYSLPILFSNLLLQTSLIVEALLLGSQGKGSLAAVGAVAPFVALIQALPLTVAAVFAVPISIAVGRRDYARLHRATHTTFTFCLLLSAAMAVLLSLLSAPLMRLIAVPEEVRPDATLYFNLNNIAFIFYLTATGGFSILQGCGDSRRPFRILIISTVSGLGLSFLFISVLRLGVLGAGLAVIFTQFISCVLVYISLFTSTEPWRLTWREMTLDREIIAETMRIALPVGIQTLIFFVTTTLIQAEINGTGSATAIAGYTIFIRLSGFLTMGMKAFGIANQNMVGQNLGAGNYDRIRQSTCFAQLYNLLFSIITTVPIVVWAAPLAGIFNSDPDVITYACGIIYIGLPLSIAFGVNDIFARMLATLGRPRFSLGVGIIAILCVRLIWIKVVMPIIGISAANIGWLFFISYTALIICDLVYYLFFPWRPPEMRRPSRKRAAKNV